MNTDLIIRTNEAPNARGGTELMQDRVYSSLPRELLEKFQIWFSRYDATRVDPSKFQIFYAHDLPNDPHSAVLANGGWRKFHRIIFVSNWQMQAYINQFGIPWSHCIVLRNAIEPIDVVEKPTDEIRIGYWSTPHRGLSIAVAVFEHMARDQHDLVFDVFSSFDLYGWGDRDKDYEQLFDKCREIPQINYHGSVDNATIRQYAAGAHVLAYPSIWPETSCLVLMEAMSAGMLCVHPNYGALYETAAGWTAMYQYSEDPNEHANRFYAAMQASIEAVREDKVGWRVQSQKRYADVFYNWDTRKLEWQHELAIIEANVPLDSVDRAIPMFVYEA